MLITLVRHGQSEANAGLTDHLDSALTTLGQEQAALTAQKLSQAGLTQAYVSPLRRTLQTIAPLCTLTGMHAEVYADICEYFNGAWPGYKTFPGLTPDQITSEFPFTFFGTTFPCSRTWWPQEPENDTLMYARAQRVRDALVGLYAGTDAHILVVSHAETVGRLTEAFLCLPAVTEQPPWSDNCAITRLQVFDPNQPAELLSQNDTSHLAALSTHAS
ncbi:MAG: histidine phosphatase family protein [Janthinobacterium lividum]